MPTRRRATNSTRNTGGSRAGPAFDRPVLLWLLGLALLLAPARARPDALVWTQAMFATTIAEYFIEEGRVLVELEIGLGDLEAFGNLLPEEIYQKLGHPPTPLPERLGRFFAQDLAIVADDGPPLAGRLLEIGPRERVKRDPITGEPLPVPEGEEEVVVFARLEYRLPGKPATLTLLAPRGPPLVSVGFVAYDRKVPVNDFRYLVPSQTLDLDWGDPWYTRFRSRALRRQYFAPMSGFLYVEPYEVRKEIIVRPLDLQPWIDLGLAGRQTIPVEMQPELERKVAEFLRGRQDVLIDGRAVEPELARVNFLERTLRTSRVIDPPLELDVYSAILGIIFVYPTDGLPQHVTMDWDLWNERIQRVPVAAVDQAGGLPSTLEPDWRVLEWRNFLKHPELPTLKLLAPPPHPWARWMWKLRWLLLAGALGAVVACVRRVRRGDRALAPVVAASLAVLLTAGCFWWSQSAQLSDARAEEVVSALLHNVYRAFDFRGEEQIYDVLARSAEGELLAQIYLETRRSLELANQGGARAKVKQVEMIDVAAEPGPQGSFVATASWNVAGSVGHWGHVHERKNRYRAELAIAPVAGSWKLVGLEVLQEERL
jgi:hypothetical protein